MLNFGDYSVAVLLTLMAFAGGIVWYAGTKITHYVAAIARRTQIGDAFAGMLLLGGLTTLPELATAGTAAASGDALLTVNDLLGSTSANLVLLALGDFIYGRDALTSLAGRPVTLMQGTLGMILLAGVGLAISTSDVAIPLVGAGVMTVVLFAACIQSLRIAHRFELAGTWQLVDAATDDADEPPDEVGYSNVRLCIQALAAGLAVLVGGAMLAMSGDVLAEKTGLGSSIVGFTLLGFSTSLPELSVVIAAIRQRRYQLAIGDVFGASLFNVLILFVADLVYREGAILNAAGRFEIGACLLAAVLIGIFMVGLLERRNRTVLRMGTDSALVLIVYVAGLVALSRL